MCCWQYVLLEIFAPFEGNTSQVEYIVFKHILLDNMAVLDINSLTRQWKCVERIYSFLLVQVQR